MQVLTCKRCGLPWCYYGVGRAVRCGKCKTPYWDRERKEANRLDSGSAVVQANSRAKGTRRIAGGIRRPYETVEGSPSYDRARPAHAAGCPSCGGMNGLHQKGCKA